MIVEQQYVEDHNASEDIAYSEDSHDVTNHGIDPLRVRSRRSSRARNLVVLFLFLAILVIPVIWKSALLGQVSMPEQFKPLVSEWYDFFLKKEGVDATDDLGVTALMRASLVGRTEEVMDLINKGANVNARDIDGETALMAASFSGYPEVVRLLVDTGADINAKSRNGSTALSIATQNRQREVEAVLRQHGATF